MWRRNSKPGNGRVRTLADPKVREMCDYIKRVTAIHKETVERLADCDRVDLIEMGELFEDVANRYLDISDEIRQIIISSAEDN